MVLVVVATTGQTSDRRSSGLTGPISLDARWRSLQQTQSEANALGQVGQTRSRPLPSCATQSRHTFLANDATPVIKNSSPTAWDFPKGEKASCK